MNKKNIFSFLILVFIVLYIICPIYANTAPEIQNGTVDLRGWDFEKNGAFNLNSGWECYPSSEYEPPNFKGTLPSVKPQIVNLPRYKGKLSTFRIVIQTQKKQSYGLYISNLKFKYKLWINGLVKSENNFLGEDINNFIVGKANISEFIDSTNGEIEIILQSYGFINDRIMFGTKDQILGYRLKKSITYLPVIFIIFFMGCYNFILFTLRKKDLSYLYAAMFCISAAFYVLTLWPEPYFYDFPFLQRLSFNTYFFIQMLSAFSTTLYLVVFLKALYNDAINSFVVKVCKLTAFALTCILIVFYFSNIWCRSIFGTSITYMVMITYLFNIIISLAGIYIIISLTMALRKNKDVLIVLVPLAFLVLTNFLEDFADFMTLGWLIFVFALIFRLSINFMRSFTHVEQLSERLTNLDRLKDDFLVNTAHELKTPMHGIIGLAESLHNNDDLTEARKEENLELIISSTRRLTGLVDNILDFARVKNSDLNLNIREVNVWQVVNTVFSVLKPIAREKNIVMINGISENLTTVNADENRLYQIIYNLAGNAVKFTQSGEIKATALEKEDVLEISISDTGIGIPEDKLESIFLPFEQVGTYEATTSSGTGLGLGITKKLVEMQGGKIFVSSKLNAGSTFSFTLPKSKNKVNEFIQFIERTRSKIEGVQENTDNEVITPHSTAAGAVILIADDEPVNLKVMQNILYDEDYTVNTVTNGLEVIKYIETNKKPDLLLLDVMMPKMSGYDVCRKVREKYPLNELPVLLLTVKNRTEDILAGFDAGANDYLTKPFNSKELKSRIKNLIDLKKAMKNAVTAELNFLQAQIKPHFLYNTFSTIHSLIRSDADKARNLLMELGNYLRESFKFKGIEHYVPLAQEIELIKSYLYIVTTRFPDKVRVEFNVDSNIDIEIPHLILQPVVENAFRHGIAKKPDGGTIIISARDEGDCVIITVEDDGIGIPEEIIPGLIAGKVKSAGIGVFNVSQRLVKMYGNALNIESVEGKGTKVILTIPKGRVNDEGNIAG